MPANSRAGAPAPAHDQTRHQQGHDRRWKQVEAWRSSKVGPCRDLVRFYESLVVFGSYSMGPDAALRPSVRAEAAEAISVE